MRLKKKTAFSIIEAIRIRHFAHFAFNAAWKLGYLTEILGKQTAKN